MKTIEQIDETSVGRGTRMTGKAKGGRFRAPLTADECREAISREVMFRGREVRLRRLYRLLKAFTDAEKVEREDRRIAALAEQNRLRQESLDLKKADYLLRFTSKPLGQRALLKANAGLKGRVAELELALAKADINEAGVKELRADATRSEISR